MKTLIDEAHDLALDIACEKPDCPHCGLPWTFQGIKSHDPSCPALREPTPPPIVLIEEGTTEEVPIDNLVEAVKALPQTVWVVGETFKNNTWTAEGIFDTEQEAIDNCKEYEFIALLPFGKRLPDNVRDVLCIYWPHRETRIEGSVKLEELRKEPIEEEIDKLIGEGTCLECPSKSK